jgi:hypothetical protein
VHIADRDRRSSTEQFAVAHAERCLPECAGLQLRDGETDTVSIRG